MLSILNFNTLRIVQILNLFLFSIFIYVNNINPELFSHFLFHDDSFYYFKIAENYVYGNGLSFSGVTVASGYHPLWLWILIWTFKFLSLLNLKLKFVEIALLLSFILMNIILYINYRIFNKHNLRGIFVLILFAFLWRFIYDGMESAVIITLLSFILYSIKYKKLILLSFSIGLLSWGRIDIFFLLLFSFISMFFFKILLIKVDRLSFFKNLIKRSDFIISISIIIVIFITRIIFASEQGSVSVKLFWFNLSYEANGISYIIIDFLKSLLAGTAQIFSPFQFIDPMWFANSNETMPRIIKFIFGLVAIVWFFKLSMLIYKQLMVDFKYIYLFFASFIICAFVFLSIHSFFGSWSPNWQWYLAFPTYALLVCTFEFIDFSIIGISNKRIFFISLVSLSLINISIYFYYLMTPRMDQWRSIYSRAVFELRLVNKNNFVVGTWAAGHIGYFYDGKVVNLEGLVESNDVLLATINDNISPIINKYKIKYIITKNSSIEIKNAIHEAKLGQTMNRSNQRTRVFKDLNWSVIKSVQLGPHNTITLIELY